MGYLRSYTADLPVEQAFFDGWFDSDDEVVHGCREANVVGFSGTTSQVPWALRIAGRIKERNPDCRIVIGGYGPSVAPQLYVDDPRCDLIVAGEGERPWREILQGAVPPEPKVVFRPAIPQLDDIPFPDRAFVRVERCIEVAKREEGRRVTGILGNRGCLRNCTFCADGTRTTIYGIKLRERTPRNIMDEMTSVQERYQLDFWKWADPELNSRGGRIKEICDEMIARNWRVPWGANFLASPMSKDEAELLYKAGCREAWVGLESGSLAIHQHIKKGVTPSLIEKAFRELKDAGILRRAYVLLGVPPETPETLKMTEDLIDRCQPDTVGFSILVAYPGTAYYDPIRDADVDWETADEYGGPNLKWHPDAMTREELLAFRWRLIEKYSSRRPKIVQKKINLGIIGPTDAKVISSEEIPLTGYVPDDPRN